MIILLVEDDEAIARGLEYSLQQEGFGFLHCSTLAAARHALANERPALVLLDIGLPDGSGYELCSAAKAQGASVIFLTACDDEGNVVMGLDMGADDYMTKPFAIEELLARIRVNLKKHRADRTAGTGARTAGKLRIEPASYGASFDGEPIMLTKKEFDLLNYLWQHEGTAVTRDELLSNVWGYEFAGDTNIVDVYIRYLRQKIDDKFGVKTIHTIRAVGYMFRYE